MTFRAASGGYGRGAGRMGRGATASGGGDPVYKTVAVNQLGSPMRGTTVATATSTFSNPVLVGNTLIATVATYISNVVSVVGSTNGAFTKLLTLVSAGDNSITVWIKTGTVASTNEVFTATSDNAAQAFLSGNVMEVSGLVGTVDVSNTVLGSGSITNSGPSTTAKSLVLSGIVNNTGGGVETFTPPAGWTIMNQDLNTDTSTSNQIVYKILNAIETSSSTVTGHQPDNTYDSFIMSFSAAEQTTAWTPTSETAGTFSMWLDGADRSTYTTSGGTVSQWNDKSGSANHAMQATPGNQPSDVTNGLFFDTGRQMLSPLSSSNNEESIFSVVTYTNSTGTRTILGSSATGGRQFRCSSVELQMVRSSVAVVAGTTGIGLTTNSKLLLESQVSFNSPVVFGLNGTLQTPAALHSTAFAAALTSQVGANNGGQWFVGNIHEILVLPTKPSAALADKIRTYLKTKWSLP